ncbi:MAG: M1 family metallopeptidase [Saprospiraceae bacterium]|nr:M1 family metallopeptidase [Saprospiraceae bacterium]
MTRQLYFRRKRKSKMAIQRAVGFIFLIFIFLNPESALSNRWQIGVQYKMNIQLDDQRHLLTGNQILTIYNESPDTLKELWYHLYYNAFQPGSDMDVRSRSLPDPDPRVKDRISLLGSTEIGFQKIKKLTIKERNQDFEIDGTIMKVDLDIPVAPGDSIIVVLDFEAQIPVQIRRTGRFNKESVAYSMAQWYPKLCNYDEHGWHTDPYIAREFYAPWGSFDVQIKLPSDYCVAATGYLQNRDECNCGQLKIETRFRTWHFIATKVHDFVWAADKEFVHDEYRRKDGRLLQFYYKKDKPYSDTWKQLQPVMDRALDIIEELVGPYPYNTYSFIQGGDGGMEYPMATLITGNRPLISLVGVAIHEWVHSWFQMVLASNESLYPWMDEGFTAYIEEEVLNQLKKESYIPGYDEKEDAHFETLSNFKTFAGSTKEEPLSTHADHYETNKAYGIAAYVKGALCLHQIRYIAGENNFWKGLRRYYELYQFKHPRPDDFFREMEKASGLELDWFKSYWINTTKTIDYAISEVNEDGHSTKISLTRVGDFPMPVDIAIVMQDSSYVYCHIPLDLMRGSKQFTIPNVKIQKSWHWVDRNYNFTLDVNKSNIKYILLDPSRMLADIFEQNDLWQSEK